MFKKCLVKEIVGLLTSNRFDGQI